MIVHNLPVKEIVSVKVCDDETAYNLRLCSPLLAEARRACVAAIGELLSAHCSMWWVEPDTRRYVATGSSV